MSKTSSAIRVALLLAGGALLTPITACSNEPKPAPAASAPVDAPAKKLQPLTGNMPANCEACGTVVAITRVDAQELPALVKPPDGRKQVYEVVIRLNAGTQQIITVDREPQLTIGQRVRIIDGNVLPDTG